MKIIVFGSSGQLGQSLKNFSDDKFFKIKFLNKNDLPIDDYDKIRIFLNQNEYDVVINAAAFTKVDESEVKSKQAFLINYLAVKNLSEICYKLGILFVHFSTDYVFNGEVKTPYKETHNTSPSGHYGRSKLKGEESIVNSNCKYIIFRTSWLFSQYGNNFLKTMLNLFLDKDLENNINVVDDQIGRPTSADDLASAVLHVLKKVKVEDDIKEIFHFSGNKIYSWHQFALEIYSISKDFGLDVVNKPKPISTNQYNKLMKSDNHFRPMYSVLDNSKFFKSYSYKQKETSKLILDCISKVAKGL